MTHVITQNCCNDAARVAVCPVNCIHPTPGAPDFATAEMLYIDPDVCIDCGACVAPCPVSAIYPDYELPDRMQPFETLNAAYFEGREAPSTPVSSSRPAWTATTDTLKVAIVGSGPAAFDVADALFSVRGLDLRVAMFERLPVVGGLVRYGVAPDHAATKGIIDEFQATMRKEGFRLFANVDVGRDISHQDLADRHHAVAYAAGAMSAKSLGIEGEDLLGSHSATEFVSWYNGHPDFAHLEFDLSCERVAIIGNGNVALDVARILTSSVDALRQTDITDAALDALARSAIQEVVVIGRRGPKEAAFSTPELIGLLNVSDINLRVDDDDTHATVAATDDLTASRRMKQDLLAGLPREVADEGKTITFAFHKTPVDIMGNGRVEAIRLRRSGAPTGDVSVPGAAHEDDTQVLECGLVLRAVGYQAEAVPGLPHDISLSTLPHENGRVHDPQSGASSTGVYAAGWIKRGTTGVIGTNRPCAEETVTSLLADFEAGILKDPTTSDVEDMLPEAIDAETYFVIDKHERAAGLQHRRPRVELVRRDDMMRIAQSTP